VRFEEEFFTVRGRGIVALPRKKRKKLLLENLYDGRGLLGKKFDLSNTKKRRDEKSRK